MLKLVREHIQEVREQFLKGDFSGPGHIHGQDMPGLTDLKAAKPGQIDMAYKDVRGGQVDLQNVNHSSRGSPAQVV